MIKSEKVGSINMRKEKVGFFHSIPICIILTLYCFPVGLILIAGRFYKKGKISKKARNIIDAVIAGTFLAIVVVFIATVPDSTLSAVASDSNFEGSTVTEFPAASEKVSDPSEIPSKRTEASSPPAIEPPNTTTASLEETPDAQLSPSVSATEGPNSAVSVMSYYDGILKIVRDDIDQIINSEPVDTEELRSNYEFLLSLRINEYVFKSYAYGYFTGDYDAEEYEDLIGIAVDISDEMKEYFDPDEVDEYFVYCVSTAHRSFDQFQFDSYLVGAASSPDINTMWDLFIAASLGIED